MPLPTAPFLPTTPFPLWNLEVALLSFSPLPLLRLLPLAPRRRLLLLAPRCRSPPPHFSPPPRFLSGIWRSKISFLRDLHAPEDGEAEAGEDGDERRSDLERRSKGDMVECLKEDIFGNGSVDIVYHGVTHTAMENRVRSENRSSAMEGVKLASEAAAAANTNRQALRDIKNIIGAPHQHHHLAVTKRGLHEKSSAADAKNQPGVFAGHRPVTRKFAAALATQPANAPLLL